MSKPKLATIGLAIGHPPMSPLPRVVTMFTITRPTTSSIMAAPTSITPTLACHISAEERIANVVHKDAEHSEAPAEKAARGVGYDVPELLGKAKIRRRKDNAIGINKQRVATDTEK
ncbi:hypothetical protein sscle_05g044410 [Sclerotinia sclerotiorum 1980 UF-70]|uniref:Uncharacterized protein n=2 Tax=Sclerotinia sclerotiorum (strain ATCC 18683 / 1980 / Ss-1) TaxID=665079 RepID=A0A1D9Q3Y1_SCLS1|nr:hypothetical protein sscle_05g044410 [Sclerotinia sclerotiorum 1980 UF-70]